MLLVLKFAVPQHERRHWGPGWRYAFARSLDECGGDTKKTNTIVAGILLYHRRVAGYAFTKTGAWRRVFGGAAGKL